MCSAQVSAEQWCGTLSTWSARAAREQRSPDPPLRQQ
eukprot:CAMPEP_0179143082 /NCGR_PEP_ID=MMETSP0796-20121207/68788_1 /TAXON_ID=73915 /ORGANISM="Pyrodinium bahamense, Strain pbaha01" /LENGTH=36 /DNA_ID= /DNA_START= /DNA_END= /DNA_ORIENTATION=